MHELDDLRAKLTTSLGMALQASAKGKLTPEAARTAAAMTLDGHGLPQEVQQIFGDRPVCSLLCFDADGIQRWVFDSERIQVAGGASLTLDHLNRDAREILSSLPEVCGEIFSAGGGGIFVAQAVESPEALAAEARRKLGQHAPGLTFTVFVEPLRVRDLAVPREPQNIQADPNLAPSLRRFQVVDGVRGALVRVQVRMEETKSARPTWQPAPPLVSTQGQLAPRCGSCGRRPPGNHGGGSDDPRDWCEWCQGMRGSFRGQRKGDFEIEGRALTFADLAESVKRQRQYLAFLAVDGNSMGNVVRALGNFLELAAFSTATTRIYERAREVAKETLQPFLADGHAPETSQLSLLSGGDEITLVLPAAAGPRVACRVLRAVEEGFDEATASGGLLERAFEKNPMALDRLKQAGASAGLVLAGNSYPVRLMRHYADALQKQAKTTAATGPRSAVAWALLTDSSPLSQMLERPGLTLEVFERHLEEAEAASRLRVPASALQAVLAQVRREGRTLASLPASQQDSVLGQLGANFFRYQLARNRRLADWWQEVESGPSRGDDCRDAVEHWFRHGQGREVDRFLDLLSIEPQEGAR